MVYIYIYMYIYMYIYVYICIYIYSGNVPESGMKDPGAAKKVTSPKATPKGKGGANRHPEGQPRPTKSILYVNVKIRVTIAGVCFSGPTAYLSNMYEREFVFEGVPYISVEQGNAFYKATAYKRPELALSVMGKTDGYEIKDMGRHLKGNPLWEKNKVPNIRGLFIAKFLQNPDLMEELILTAPARLIEASRDPLWGGGRPFESSTYDDDTFEGFNVFGDELTQWRDEQIALRAKGSGK